MGLTVVTLVFGELIPKSLGVSNAEMVARIMVRVRAYRCNKTDGRVHSRRRGGPAHQNPPTTNDNNSNNTATRTHTRARKRDPINDEK